jgi:hypothetical protein
MILKNNNRVIQIDSRFDEDNNIIIYLFNNENQIWEQIYKLKVNKKQHFKKLNNNLNSIKNFDLFEVINND